MSNNFKFACCFCLLNTIIFVPHHPTYITTENHFLLSKSYSKKLLNCYGSFVVEMSNQKFVYALDESIITFSVQIKPILCHKCRNILVVDKQCVMNEWQKCERLTLNHQFIKNLSILTLGFIQFREFSVPHFLQLVFKLCMRVAQI